MRIIKLLSITLIFCFLQNCGTDQIDIVNRTYRLENETQHEIKMEFYAFGIFQQTRQIIGEGLIFEGSMDNEAGKGIAASGALNADSIIVIFDNSKLLTFTNISLENKVNISPSTRNVLLNNAYEVRNNELYRFVFTEQDYEKAE